MLNLYVQQNQWIAVTLMAGTALVLLFWLTYRAMWRPRSDEQRGEAIHVTGMASFVRWLLSFVPVVLILLVVLVTIYTVTHLVWAATRVPNW